jgi:RNA polymerase sigma factor (TIGR02999 family)
MGDISVLIQRACGGDQAASDQLFTELYADLRKLAARQLRQVFGDGSHATSLVHEAYFRLAKPKALAVVDRAHFFGVAGRAMRQLVIDHARQRQASKRGGVNRDLPLDALDEAAMPVALTDTRDIDVFALDQALQQLGEIDASLARLVELRFFAGMELAEIAEILQRSERSLKRDWRKARAFLHARLSEDNVGLTLPE